MPYYRFLFERTVLDIDLIFYIFVCAMLFLFGFFLFRDFFRERKKDFSGPTGKMVAGTICMALGVLHVILILFILPLY